MKRKLLPLFLLFFVSTPVYAESSSVTVRSTTKSGSNFITTNSESNTKSETHIKVETNGKVTEYNSDKPGNVEVKSINGESSIKVNGETVSGNPTAESTDDQSPTATPSPTPKPDETKEDKQNAIEEFIETIDNAIEKLFSVFR